MQTVTIQGQQNETFTIGKVEDISELKALSSRLILNGKEAVIYHLDRVIVGTRKKAYSIQCYRFVETGTFIKAF